MKKTLSFCLALVAATAAQAQIFRSEAVNGAILGGIAGGVIGHQSGGNNGWQGAALGATAGLLIGQAVGDANAYRDGYRGGRGEYVYRSSPRVHVGIGYGHVGHYGHGRHGYYGHGGHFRHRDFGWGVSYWPSYGYPRAYSGYSHIGYRDYGYYRPVVVQAPQPVVVQPQPAPAAPATAPQQVTIINNYYNQASPMSSANGLFGR